MDFELAIAEERVKPHQITALHIIVALALFIGGALFYFMHLLFAYSIFKDTTPHTISLIKMEGLLTACIGLGLLAVIIFKHNWILQPAINRNFRILEILVVLAVAFYALSVKFVAPAATYGILALALLFSVFWEKNSSAAIKVRINEQGIKLPPNTKRRSLPWTAVDQVLLRYGTLSVNCTDNTLYQWNMNPIDVNSKDFEDFCHKLIEDNKSKRIKDW